MKVILVFFTVVGLSFGAPKFNGLLKHKVAPRSLVDDFLDLEALINVDEIKAIVDKHLKNDGTFVAVVQYLQGPKWTALVEEVSSNPEVQNFIKYLTDAGFPVDAIIQWIHDLIQNAVPGTEADANGNLRPLLDEVEAIIPVDKLIALWNDKLQTSPDFQDFYVRISSEEAHSLIEEVRAIPEVQRLEQRLKDLGVKVDETLAIIYGLFGWGKPEVKRSPRSLIDDFIDIESILPVDDIKAIVDKHLQNDGTFVAVIKYLQGPQWAALVEEVDSNSEVLNFMKYLTDAGFPVDVIIQWIHDLIQNAVPGTEADVNGSLRPLLDEVEAIIPVDKLIALWNDKLQTSPDFQDFYVRISSEEAHSLIEEVRAIPEVQCLEQRLKDMGVKINETLTIIYGLFGWGKPEQI